MAVNYSDEVLEETPERATQFLAAMGAVPVIRTVMHEAGMTDADIAEGRTLLLACLAAPQPTPPNLDTAEAAQRRAAVVEIDAWDEPNFACARAALGRFHPSACEYVFTKLAPARGADAVQGVATFLARVAALELGTDPARAATREDDKQAVERLAQRGITKDVRTRMQGLVDLALGPSAPLAPAPTADPEVRRRALTDLKVWFDDWSATARARIRKRNYLIRLGLAHRRSPRAEVEAPETAPAALE